MEDGSCGVIGSCVRVMGVNSTKKGGSWFLRWIGSEGGIYPSDCYHFYNRIFDFRSCFSVNSFSFLKYFQNNARNKENKRF